jgi:hypothetical protein
MDFDRVYRLNGARSRLIRQPALRIRPDPSAPAIEALAGRSQRPVANSTSDRHDPTQAGSCSNTPWNAGPWPACGRSAPLRDRANIVDIDVDPLAALSPTANTADAAELRARLTDDLALALRAADLRRDQLDYRGMARALALAAQFATAPNAAADLYLRAGRSAAGQGDTAQARLWLNQARELAPDAGLRTEADDALHELPAP